MPCQPPATLGARATVTVPSRGLVSIPWPRPEHRRPAPLPWSPQGLARASHRGPCRTTLPVHPTPAACRPPGVSLAPVHAGMRRLGRSGAGGASVSCPRALGFAPGAVGPGQHGLAGSRAPAPVPQAQPDPGAQGCEALSAESAAVAGLAGGCPPRAGRSWMELDGAGGPGSHRHAWRCGCSPALVRPGLPQVGREGGAEGHAQGHRPWESRPGRPGEPRPVTHPSYCPFPLMSRLPVVSRPCRLPLF